MKRAQNHTAHKSWAQDSNPDLPASKTHILSAIFHYSLGETKRFVSTH